MYIPRKQIENIHRLLEPGKVIVIYGARRVGKTTLVKKFIEEWASRDQKILFVNGDDIFPRQYVESQSVQKLLTLWATLTFSLWMKSNTSKNRFKFKVDRHHLLHAG